MSEKQTAALHNELDQLEMQTLGALASSGPATAGVLKGSEVATNALDQAAASSAGVGAGTVILSWDPGAARSVPAWVVLWLELEPAVVPPARRAPVLARLSPARKGTPTWVEQTSAAAPSAMLRVSWLECALASALATSAVWPKIPMQPAPSP